MHVIDRARGRMASDGGFITEDQKLVNGVAALKRGIAERLAGTVTALIVFDALHRCVFAY